jgi:hypothetical protein
VIVFRGRSRKYKMTILDDGTVRITIEVGISDTEVSVDIIHNLDLENFTINSTDIDDICSSVAEELKSLFNS